MITFLSWLGTAFLVAQIATYIHMHERSPVPWVFGIFLCLTYIAKAVILMATGTPLAVVLLVVWVLLFAINLHVFGREMRLK